jgi:hypothetical protein
MPCRTVRDSPNQLPAYDILQVRPPLCFLPRSNSPTDRCILRSRRVRLHPTRVLQNPRMDDLARYLSRRHRHSRVHLPAFLPSRILISHRYTALQHSLTCTPLTHDFRWSQTLLDASADPIAAINHRNRYGTTAIHEAVMSYRRPGEEELRVQVLKWLLARGANMDSTSLPFPRSNETDEKYSTRWRWFDS